MTNRDKVIEEMKELCEHLFHEYKTCYHGDEEDAYNRFLSANNALNLLEEQEPRVMTLEEVRKHNNKDNCVWFELRDIVIIPVFLRQDRQETIIENPCILSDQTIPHLYWKNIDYCKKWRCWNTKPTDEQRKAAKWGD